MQELHRQKAHIVFLQETHFRANSIPSLRSSRFQIAYHATNPDAKSKGVTILVAKNLPLQITDTKIDLNGRYIFLKGTLGRKTITLANVYAPNSHHRTFIREICDTLTTFKEGLTILGGDLNAPLCPSLDSSTGSSSMPYSTLRHIKTELASLELHDTWRFLHPSVKDYTFYSHTQNKYSRIDYFFLSQPDLPTLCKATIETMVVSDHHPISMTISLSDTDDRTKIWRYDPTLLSDVLAMDQIQTSMKHYFEENATPDVSPLTIWEAHKCVIRGELLRLGALRKRGSQQKIKKLIADIRALERTHKLRGERDALQKLMDARTLLLEEMGRKHKRRVAFSQKLFYDQSNKPGRLLARTLRAKQAASRIHTIRDSGGVAHVTTRSIAGQFRQFYESLYNIQGLSDHPDTSDNQRSIIRQFLEEYGPAQLTT